MRRAVLMLGLTGMLMLCLTLGILWWIGATEQGTRWATGVLVRQLPSLRIRHAEGRLFDSLRLQGVLYRGKSVDLQIGEASLRWRPFRLLQGTLALDNFTVNHVHITLSEQNASAENAPEHSSTGFTLPLNVNARAELHDVRIVQDKQTFTLETLQADTRINARKPQANAALHWNGLTWRSGQNRVLCSKEGEAAFDGWMPSYTLALRTQLQKTAVPQMDLQLHATGDSDGLNDAKLSVETLGGTVDANATLKWSKALRWDVTVGGQDIDPGKAYEEWPGTLAFRLKSSGTPQRFSLRLLTLNGSVRGLPVRGDTDAVWNGNALEIKHAAIEALDAHVALSGRVDPQGGSVDMQLSVPQIAAFVPEANGTIDANASFEGPWRSPQGRATFVASRLLYNAYGIAHAKLSIASKEHGRMHAILHAEGAHDASRTLSRLDAVVDGTTDHHAINVNALTGDANLSLQADGGFSPSQVQWEGVLEQVMVIPKAAGGWRLERPSALRFDAKTFSLQRTCLLPDDGLKARICIGANSVQGRVEANALLQAFPMKSVNPWLQNGMRLEGVLDAEMALHGSRRDLNGTLKAHIGNAVLSLSGTVGLKMIEFSVQHCKATLQNGMLHSELSALIPDYNTSLNAWANLFGLDSRRNRTVHAGVQLTLPHLEVLQPLVNEIHGLQGMAEANISVDGSLEHPSVSARGTLNNVAFTLLQSGTHFENLNLGLALPKDSDHLQFQGRSGQEKAWIALHGDVVQLWKEPQLRLNIDGKNFQAVSLPHYHVVVDPALRIVADAKHIGIEGNVSVPEADIVVRKLPPQAVSVSQDAVIAGEDTQHPSGPEIDADVMVTIGERVKVEALGLKGSLAGALRVSRHSPAPPMAVGTLRVNDGSFDAYGLTLALKKGVLNFAGPIDNPGLDIVAQRQTGSVTAILSVTGSAKSPHTSISSDPPMAQAEALSWLLTGHGLDAASRSDAALLAQALYAMNSSGDEGVLSKLKQKTGLDEIGVEGGSELQQSALILGTYLTPDIYVRYTTGLFDYVNTLSIIYRLTSHLSVELQSGAVQAMNIWYDIRFGR